MIFLTVGTQLPFDRMTSAVDAWCAETGQGASVFGQIGHLAPDSYRPKHFEWVEMVDPPTFDKHIREASAIVSHAGMGSIITAMSSGTPIVIFPRRGHLGEQRNDHQFATVQWFADKPGIFAAGDETALPAVLNRVMGGDAMTGGGISPFASKELIDALRGFIHEGEAG